MTIRNCAIFADKVIVFLHENQRNMMYLNYFNNKIDISCHLKYDYIVGEPIF